MDSVRTTASFVRQGGMERILAEMQHQCPVGRRRRKWVTELAAPVPSAVRRPTKCPVLPATPPTMGAQTGRKAYRLRAIREERT